MSAAAPGIGVYVHWPYCRRVCPYCDFNVARARGREAEGAALAEALVADLIAQAGRLGRRSLVSVFFGGGTPSLMAPDLVARMVATAAAAFPPSGPVEVALEANPADASAPALEAFAAAGVNRLSLGVQSLSDGDLRFLGRDHDAAVARAAARRAAAIFPRLSVDLIYALPGQDVGAWREQLQAALLLGAEHVSAYQLTIEPGTAFGARVRRGALAPADTESAAALFETTQQVLSAAGFEAYEISNHARDEEARCRHNLHAWRGGEYLGVGPGAHGRIDLAGERCATLAPRRGADYIAAAHRGGGAAVIEPLTVEQRALERLAMGLRTLEGVALVDLAALGPDAEDLEALAAHRLVAVAGGRLTLTAPGRLVADAVAARIAGGGRLAEAA
ncbi:MAG TPA: radical SAM family heme chaperone HemW [Caulobacteraceae bacterium]|nr:radical SAM family heme chaperone HemW [Caulobacteraceae bacterium]